MDCSHPPCRCGEAHEEHSVERDGKPFCSTYCAEASRAAAEDVEPCRCGHPACRDPERPIDPAPGRLAR